MRAVLIVICEMHENIEKPTLRQDGHSIISVVWQETDLSTSVHRVF